jgi:hypothetical protein
MTTWALGKDGRRQRACPERGDACLPVKTHASMGEDPRLPVKTHAFRLRPTPSGDETHSGEDPRLHETHSGEDPRLHETHSAALIMREIGKKWVGERLRAAVRVKFPKKEG